MAKDLTEVSVAPDSYHVSPEPMLLIADLHGALALCLHDEGRGVGGLLHLKFMGGTGRPSAGPYKVSGAGRPGAGRTTGRGAPPRGRPPRGAMACRARQQVLLANARFAPTPARLAPVRHLLLME